VFDEIRRSLRHSETGQSIQEMPTAVGEARSFEYRGGAVTIPFVLEVVDSRRVLGFVDFNRTDMEVFRQTYGLWRRVSFFLLDSLVVWLFAVRGARERFWRVELIGGWQNGLWNRSLVLQGVVVNPHGALNQLERKPSSVSPCPLDQAPRSWRYLPAESSELETVLSTVVGPGGLPILDRRVSADRQIARAPRFARDDGDAFLFHRFIHANFHRGEDYDPQPYYGYLNGEAAFTMRAYGVDSFSDPI
jgi:hypothetical protein